MAELAPQSRKITTVGSTRRMSHGTGFVAYCLRLSTVGSGIDPFLSIDHFYMSQPIFPPHPHAGFSAVTYMFEDSEGGFVNRDSTGDRSFIQPGDLHWTQAGRGVVHEEVPIEPGKVCHGVQMFVNLAAADKFKRPRALHLENDYVPEFRPSPEVRVRVLVGNAHGLMSPISPLNKVTLLDVHLAPGVSMQHELTAYHSAFVMMVRGDASFGPMLSQSQISDRQVGLMEGFGKLIEVTAGAKGAQYLLMSGEPLKEAIVAHGAFVMNTNEQIRKAVTDYSTGLMGTLDPTY